MNERGSRPFLSPTLGDAGVALASRRVIARSGGACLRILIAVNGATAEILRQSAGPVSTDNVL
jgi:hypothetical protein